MSEGKREIAADIAIVGGGAAGLMAGAFAVQGLKVVIVERNGAPGDPFTGKKLNITGKGRCNVTNNCTVEEVIKNTPRNGKFLYSALSAFSPSDVITFFENSGLKLKTERGNRVFPESDRAADVTNTLRKVVRQNGVKFVLGRALSLDVLDGKLTGIMCDTCYIKCKACILATGGKSYPLTGSTGDGYAIVTAVGHSVTPTCASIVPLECEDSCCADMQGLALKNVGVKAFSGDTVIFKDFGELLFTHFGISGPVVLSMSAHLRDYASKQYSVSIDLKPALDEKTLDLRLIREFEENKNKSAENMLIKLLPRAMTATVAARAGIAGKQINAITKEERQRLLSVLKNFRLTVTAARPVEEAVVTSGGVTVGEITPKTMGSKLVNGLYFAGEIIDVDAYTGGFNLQIAWATGRAAMLGATSYVLMGE